MYLVSHRKLVKIPYANECTTSASDEPNECGTPVSDKPKVKCNNRNFHESINPISGNVYLPKQCVDVIIKYRDDDGFICHAEGFYYYNCGWMAYNGITYLHLHPSKVLGWIYK